MEIKDSIEHTYMSATKFEQVAYQQLQLFNLSGSNPPVQQYVVNITFALELHLKCLIMIETNEKPIHEHNLKRLFNALLKEDLTAIKKNYQTLIKKNMTLKVIRNEGIKVNSSFWHVIEEMQKSYNEWRYISIDGLPKNNIIGTGEIINAVKKRINELHQF